MAKDAFLNDTCLPVLDRMKILGHPDPDISRLGVEIKDCPISSLSTTTNSSLASVLGPAPTTPTQNMSSSMSEIIADIKSPGMTEKMAECAMMPSGDLDAQQECYEDAKQ